MTCYFKGWTYTKRQETIWLVVFREIEESPIFYPKDVVHSLGKNIVFTMTIKLIPKFLRKEEIPEKFWKRYEEVKYDFFLN